MLKFLDGYSLKLLYESYQNMKPYFRNDVKTDWIILNQAVDFGANSKS